MRVDLGLQGSKLCHFRTFAEPVFFFHQHFLLLHHVVVGMDQLPNLIMQFRLGKLLQLSVLRDIHMRGKKRNPPGHRFGNTLCKRI